jgi:hypothetical protein
MLDEKCPTNLELVLFAEESDELHPIRILQITEHLDHCATCSYKVAWCREEDD